MSPQRSPERDLPRRDAGARRVARRARREKIDRRKIRSAAGTAPRVVQPRYNAILERVRSASARARAGRTTERPLRRSCIARLDLEERIRAELMRILRRSIFFSPSRRRRLVAHRRPSRQSRSGDRCGDMIRHRASRSPHTDRTNCELRNHPYATDGPIGPSLYRPEALNAIRAGAR